MICLEDFDCSASIDSESSEFPVTLPCLHVVGFRCLRTWLAPEEERNNTCPICRQRFFDLPPERESSPESELSPLVGDDIHPDWDALVDFMLSHGFYLTARGWRWHGSLLRVADDATRRDTAVSILRDQYPDFDNSKYYEYSRHPIDDVVSRKALVGQASALLTRRAREAALYIQLQHLGSVLPELSRPLNGLNEEEAEYLFLELQDLGAFDPGDSVIDDDLEDTEAVIVDDNQDLVEEVGALAAHDTGDRDENGWNEEMWEILREKGMVYNVSLDENGALVFIWFRY